MEDIVDAHIEIGDHIESQFEGYEQLVKVKETFIHPEYENLGYGHNGPDLCLIHTEEMRMSK